MRVLLYLRTSSDAQAKLGTIEAQRQELPRVAERQGWQIVETVEDDGMTGRRLKGRALDDVLTRIRSGALNISAILCADASRLMRPDPDDEDSQHEWVTIRSTLRKYDVGVADMSGRVRSFKGSMLLNEIEQAVAAEEWMKIRDRTVMGKRVGARAGRPMTSRLPYGYRWVRGEKRQDGRWDVYPERARIVTRIFDWYTREQLGASIIAARLNAEGVAPPYGQQWHLSTIFRIVRQSAYRGRWMQRIGSETYESEVPRIIDERTWELAQGCRTKRGRKKTTQPLLGGLLRCGHCGRAVCGTSQKRPDGTRKVSYQCTSASIASQRNGKPCALRTVVGAELDAGVWERVCVLLSDPSQLMLAASLQEDTSELRSLEREVEHLTRLVEKADEDAVRADRRARRGLVTEKQLVAILKDIKREREALDLNLARAEERLQKSREAESIATSLEGKAQEWADAFRTDWTVEEKRRVLLALCRRKTYGFTLTREENGTVTTAMRLALELAPGQYLDLEVAAG